MPHQLERIVGTNVEVGKDHDVKIFFVSATLHDRQDSNVED